jgi:hypothetical protein
VTDHSSSKTQLAEWVRERLDNCQRLAATKTGADRDGWLEDAHYFAEILRVVSATVEPKSDHPFYLDGLSIDQWREHAKEGWRQAADLRAVPPPKAFPWDSQTGGCVSHFDYNKRRVTISFERQEDFDAMHDLIVGAGPTKSAAHE